MVLQIYSAIYLMMHTCIMASTFSLRRLMSPGINGRQCGNNVRCINKHGRSPAVQVAAHFKTIASTLGRFITYAEDGLGVLTGSPRQPVSEESHSLFCLLQNESQTSRNASELYRSGPSTKGQRRSFSFSRGYD